jgi:hypothetical protein
VGYVFEGSDEIEVKKTDPDGIRARFKDLA